MSCPAISKEKKKGSHTSGMDFMRLLMWWNIASSPRLSRPKLQLWILGRDFTPSSLRQVDTIVICRQSNSCTLAAWLPRISRKSPWYLEFCHDERETEWQSCSVRLSAVTVPPGTCLLWSSGCSWLHLALPPPVKSRLWTARCRRWAEGF